ncbi:MAG TPA: Rieske (2Fe-2S) protein, partial [Beijerinckiaceae bacterium]|nr:Rieske (2Fe-2S) protein [Beijerinckiaceae bacterium]
GGSEKRMAQIFVCDNGDMKDGDIRIVRQDRLEIGVYRYAGSYYAYRNHCLHQGGPACEGVLKGRVLDLFGEDKSFRGQTYDYDDPHIVCPWHGWEYRLLTGECAPDPTLRLKKYEVVQQDGGVYVVT